MYWIYFRSSSSPLFNHLHLLRIFDINRLHTALFMFRYKNNLLPISCINYVALANIDYIHDTRNKSYFKVAKCRSTIRELSIATREPKLWDSLPDDVKGVSSIELFRLALTNFYVNSY